MVPEPEPVKELEAFSVLPVNESPVPRATDCKLLLASLITKLDAVRVAIFTFPNAVTCKTFDPEEEAMVNGFTAPAPWTKRVDVGVMVPMPTLAKVLPVLLAARMTLP